MNTPLSVIFIDIIYRFYCYKFGLYYKLNGKSLLKLQCLKYVKIIQNILQ